MSGARAIPTHDPPPDALRHLGPRRRAPEAPPVSRAHHGPGGGFRDPWPPHPEGDRRPGAFLRWMASRVREGVPEAPAPGDIPREVPAPARPLARPGEIRITWVGHATLLVQSGGLTLLTDPVWSDRVTPVPGFGPVRFSPPGLALDALPPVHGVLLSHDHFDHLDAPTVRRLVERFGPGLPWIVPLGHATWLRRRGVERVTELDWWEETALRGHRLVALPARHWTRRGLRSNRRLWVSWAVLPGEVAREDAESHGEAPGRDRGRPSASEARRPGGVYLGGDTGYAPHFREIGARLGPFRATVLPIGAYAPRWFMAPAHLDPEEAVRAWEELGGEGVLMGMHWGTFRLSDEPPLEPPRRARAAWEEAGHTAEALRLPGIGGTVRIPPER